ncbi:M56 family metallopeptidase [Maribellus maritimus]|uniref:M56 family metallopeptidase n=1 Tax=Maribellus maritimus TaxID=2870838 RepID=UPI001EEA9CAE|nr:M56 family metallopeptidase [Maribellus maritimus]MCG6188577.1 hypothetical protein [Maribellus maritimus]
MILYVLRFSLALALILGFYKLLLEKEKSYNFNRFYLLGGLLFSLIVPLISFGASRDVKQIINEMPVYIPTNYNHQVSLLVLVYWIITSLFFLRFGVHIFDFIRKIRKHERLTLEHAVVVLTDQKITPYSFLKYIFIRKEQYDSIPPEILKHELAHVTQLHTIDIFFIELVKNFIWVNPMLIIYKRAMQLNHEFLADNSVVHSHNNIKYYQGLLIDYLDASKTPLSCGFNFSVTKKRLKMMRKQKEKIHSIKQSMVIPLFILILIACSDNPGVSGEEMLKYWRSTANMEEVLRTGTMDDEELKKGIIVPIETKARYDSLMDIYNRMNKAQKKSVYKLPAYLEPIAE